MDVARRLPLVVIVAVLVAVGCGTVCAAASAGAGTKSSRAARITAIVERSVVVPSQVNGVVYGVWQRGRRIVTGALGNAQAGVAARRGMHVRIGNTAESMLATVLLRFVDQGKLSLSDRLSKWYPNLPNANKVTLRMLADSTTGYNDFVTTDEFNTLLHADPFRQFRVPEVIAIAMSKPPLFEPGTNWAFSDTNFLLLGQVLQKVGRKPIEVLQREQIFEPAGLTRTAATRSTAIPPPVLHAYTSERGPYEESTYWTTSWIPGVVDVTSTAGDMGKWARALGRGTLLSEKTHAIRLAPNTAGLGPMTRRMYYTFGTAVSKRWVVNNPQVLGYTGIVAYNLRRDLSVAIFTTQGPQGDIAEAYATAIYEPLARYLTPRDVPPLSALPRGKSGNR